MATFPIYEMYIELEGFKPTMWRRFQIMGDASMAKLAYTIMALYEVRKFYSYEFRIDELANFLIQRPEYVEYPELLKNLNREFKKLRYGLDGKKNIYSYQTTDGYGQMEDATKTRLMDVIKHPNEKFMFRYDPEINWTFHIVVEKIFTSKSLYAKDFPQVLGGAEYGIIETLAGVNALQKARDKMEKTEWLNNTGHTDFITKDKMKHLRGRKKNKNKRFYFDEFDLEDMNYRIRKLPQVYRDRYENHINMCITQIHLMKRKYKVIRKNVDTPIDKKRKK